jgi:hypothetical protein
MTKKELVTTFIYDFNGSHSPSHYIKNIIKTFNGTIAEDLTPEELTETPVITISGDFFTGEKEIKEISERILQSLKSKETLASCEVYQKYTTLFITDQELTLEELNKELNELFFHLPLAKSTIINNELIIKIPKQDNYKELLEKTKKIISQKGLKTEESIALNKLQSFDNYSEINKTQKAKP